MMMEKNSDQIAEIIANWIDKVITPEQAQTK